MRLCVLLYLAWRSVVPDANASLRHATRSRRRTSPGRPTRRRWQTSTPTNNDHDDPEATALSSEQVAARPDTLDRSDSSAGTVTRELHYLDSYMMERADTGVSGTAVATSLSTSGEETLSLTSSVSSSSLTCAINDGLLLRAVDNCPGIAST